MRSSRLATALTALVLLAAGCGDDDEGSSANDSTTAVPSESTTTTAAGTEGVLAVPEDFATIQEAVDAATPGDLILIGPGTYNEGVVVQTENLTIRGLDRNEVILDGQGEAENGIIVFSNGVAIENLTVHDYNSNGIFFTGDYDSDFILTGYRASYITAYNNGQYGIYAFNASDGLIENSYASGNPDSGFYIGQCQPCNAVVRNVVSEFNALGYSGTNAGGELYLIDSEWRNNRVGMVPNTLDSEQLAPQHGITIAGNWVHDNGNQDTPLKNASWDLAFGVGIALAGGNDNLVLRNLVVDNPNVGIVPALFADDNVWPAERNTVRENRVSGSRADLGLLVLDPSQGPAGNCFENNEFTTSMPADIETVAPCSAAGTPFADQVAPNSEAHSSKDYREMPVPGPQENMPDAATAPARPATDVPPSVDLDAIEVPAGR